MSKALAANAVLAVDDDAYERAPSMCQRFVRQNIQAIHGNRFNKFHKGSAHESYLKWKDSKFAVPPDHGSTIGDILYWKATAKQPDGHVGIRVPHSRLAENSIVHKTPKNGARGFRSIFNLRAPDLIVRLPEPEKEPER